MSETVLEVNNLRTWFHTDEGIVKAVDGVDFRIGAESTVCIVGESGCGKSITARSILNLIDKPGRIEDGEMIYHYADGRTVDIAKLDPRGAEIRSIRGKQISMIFQEPMSSLGPVSKIGTQLMETLLLHLPLSTEEAKERSIELLRQVGIPRAETRLDTYPFQLSGGMRQRVMIALALACEPRLLIADEPTTALDVTTQATILDLMLRLQKERGMSVMFITHDLGVVAEIADVVVVMYLGRVVERADVRSLFAAPKHPYTKALLESIPRVDFTGHKRLASIEGIVPHPFNRPAGCPFSDRCPSRFDRCGEEPDIFEVGTGHSVRCWLHAERGGI